MNTFESIKEELFAVCDGVSELLNMAVSVSDSSSIPFAKLQETCDEIKGQIMEGVIRVAVIGSIKSGKSTLVNYLLRGDYLKRSAGVVTSIVTKIRRGRSTKAKLVFKSWDEINRELRQAIILMPSLKYGNDEMPFDIRKAECRKALEEVLSSLSESILISGDSINPQIILLSSYMKGFDKVKDIVGSDNVALEFDREHFARHKEFVGNDAYAVFLKDVILEIDNGFVDSNVEIADCQGSDSPNPLHLAMIQDYLFYTNLNIYVISSRTGLRQADIKFLSIIKKMGIMDTMIFIVNCDINEHDSVDDLNRLVEKIKEELSIFEKTPELYYFSALLNLFKALAYGKNNQFSLTEKDMAKLRQWEKEKDFSQILDEQTSLFETAFEKKLKEGRYRLLLKNPVERLDAMVSSLKNQAEINRNILERDKSSGKRIIEKIELSQKQMEGIKEVIKKTLLATSGEIKDKVKYEVDSFFSPHTKSVIKDLLEYIREQQIDYERYADKLDSDGLSSALYIFYHDFKARIDTFIAERVTPELIRFVKEKENEIKTTFDSVSYPYTRIIQDYVEKYQEQLKELGLDAHRDKPPLEKPIAMEMDLESIKSKAGLSLPRVEVAMDFSPKIKAEAIMHLGIFKLYKVIRQVFKRGDEEGWEMISALKKGAKLIFKETEKAILSSFVNYDENLKFMYFNKLVDLVSDTYYEKLIEIMQTNAADITQIADLIDGQQYLKEKALKDYETIEREAATLSTRIQGIKKAIGEVP